MSPLNVAFWNVQNLFQPPVARRFGRGPQTIRERNAKLDRLASVIDGFFHGQGPDLLALAPWAGRAGGAYVGASDHLPLLATLDVI